MRILLVEDDGDAAMYLVRGLRESGHLPERVADGREGLGRALTEDYQLVIVDRMLPGMDGLEIVRAMRRQGRQTPVLVLSALGEVDDRVAGLRAGGDDYLVKPFSFTELLARLEALARRAHPGQSVPVLAVSDLRMDRLGREVTRCGQRLNLQPREFRLLEYLMLNAGQVVTRTMLLENVWGYHFDPQTNVIDVHISRLRRKIDRGFQPPLLQTVRGAGYCLREP